MKYIRSENENIKKIIFIVKMYFQEIADNLLNIISENLTDNVYFGAFVISTVTFSSVLTLIFCKNSNRKESDIVRIKAIEHDLGSVSSVLKNLSDKVDTNTKQITFRLDMQNADQESIRDSIQDLQIKYNKIEDCLIESE